MVTLPNKEINLRLHKILGKSEYFIFLYLEDVDTLDEDDTDDDVVTELDVEALQRQSHYQDLYSTKFLTLYN